MAGDPVGRRAPPRAACPRCGRGLTHGALLRRALGPRAFSWSSLTCPGCGGTLRNPRALRASCVVAVAVSLVAAGAMIALDARGHHWAWFLPVLAAAGALALAATVFLWLAVGEIEP